MSTMQFFDSIVEVASSSSSFLSLTDVFNDVPVWSPTWQEWIVLDAPDVSLAMSIGSIKRFVDAAPSTAFNRASRGSFDGGNDRCLEIVSSSCVGG